MKLKDLVPSKDYSNELQIHKKLNYKLWQDEEIKPKILKKLNMIVDAFIKLKKIEEKILDVIIIGSSCDINYTNKSDIDIHLVVDLDEESDEYKLLVMECKLWNETPIFIFTHKVEISPQSKNSTTISKDAAQFSIKYNKWIKEPNYEFTITDDMKNEINKQVETTIQLAHSYYKQNDGISLQKLIKKLKDERRDAVSTDGEMSIPNLVFKTLRNLGCIVEWMDRVLRFELLEKLNRV